MGVYLNGVGSGKFKATLSAQDVTALIKSVTINKDFDKIDVTPMASDGHQYDPGLVDESIEVEFFQNLAASKTDAVMVPLLGVSNGSTLVIIAGGTTASATTPSYTLIGAPFNYTPIDGSVGDPTMPKVTFLPGPGNSIVRATA